MGVGLLRQAATSFPVVRSLEVVAVLLGINLEVAE